jgi:hypothetical protein
MQGESALIPRSFRVFAVQRPEEVKQIVASDGGGECLCRRGPKVVFGEKSVSPAGQEVFGGRACVHGAAAGVSPWRGCNRILVAVAGKQFAIAIRSPTGRV